MQGSDSESRPGTCPGPMPSNMSLFAHGPAAGWQIRGPAAGRTHATLGYSFAICLLINQGVMATLQKRRLGYHSLPSGSQTRNLRILDPAYRPIRYGGIYAHIKRDSNSESGRRGVQRSPSSHPFMISPSPDQPLAVNVHARVEPLRAHARCRAACAWSDSDASHAASAVHSASAVRPTDSFSRPTSTLESVGTHGWLFDSKAPRGQLLILQLLLRQRPCSAASRGLREPVLVDMRDEPALAPVLATSRGARPASHHAGRLRRDQDQV
jgi:hypothetical protein